MYSGVVTILFTGIAARRYVNKNISDPLKVIASFLFQLLSYLAETSCFLLLGAMGIVKTCVDIVFDDSVLSVSGVSIFLNDLPTYNAAFIAGTVTMCILSRALIVYPLLMMVHKYIHTYIHTYSTLMDPHL
jgi:NhaP-type Na+/H+ or K+/H+ antiporter